METRFIDSTARRAALVLGLITMTAPMTYPSLARNLPDYIDYSAEDLPGRLYVPPSAGRGSPRPFILALHGGGGIGGDNLNHLVDFNGILAEANERGAFLYLPQATTAFWHLADRRDRIMAMIDRAIEELNADSNRLYITGFSMGGGGVWDFVNLHSDRFAAAAPIAGIVPRSEVDYGNLIKTPIWAFHARNDSVVTFQNSRNEINAILGESGDPPPSYPLAGDRTVTMEYVHDTLDLRYTEWPDGDHFIWNRVYGMEEMYDWLFARTLDKKTTARLAISKPRLDASEALLSFDVTTDPIVNVEIEFSSTLKDWIHVRTLTNANGKVSFQTSTEDFPDSAFFRIRQAQ